MDMKIVIILLVYLSGVIINLCLGISALKHEGGKVSDLFAVISISVLSWITLISLSIAYSIEKISNSDFWNKEIFK